MLSFADIELVIETLCNQEDHCFLTDDQFVVAGLLWKFIISNKYLKFQRL